MLRPREVPVPGYVARGPELSCTFLLQIWHVQGPMLQSWHVQCWKLATFGTSPRAGDTNKRHQDKIAFPKSTPPCVQAIQTNDTKTKLHSQGPLLEPPGAQTIQRQSCIPKVHFRKMLGQSGMPKTKLHSEGPLLEPPRVQAIQTISRPKTTLHSQGPLLEPHHAQAIQTNDIWYHWLDENGNRGHLES